MLFCCQHGGGRAPVDQVFEHAEPVQEELEHRPAAPERQPSRGAAAPADSAGAAARAPGLLAGSLAADTPSTVAALAQDRPSAEVEQFSPPEVASESDAAQTKTVCSLGSTCGDDLDLSSVDNDEIGTLFTSKVDEQRAVLLDEDKVLFDFDVRRREDAQAAVPHLRQRADGLLAEVTAEAYADAANFCSDDTLARYLITSEGNVEKAASMLKATLEWRASFFKGVDKTFVESSGSAPSKTLCPCCQSDPRQHSFFRIGTDAAGRDVIYSCAGRSLNKNCQPALMHMALELERMFRGSSAPGQAVWIIDFAGFGLADCNPRAGLAAVPMFANHYSERFAQIVLFGMPALANSMVRVIMKLVDSVTRRRVVILKSEAAQKRYMDAYWSHDLALLEWVQAALRTKGAPGCYPEAGLSQALKDDSAVEMLGRCAAL